MKNDFEIEDGVLLQYHGTNISVIIPNSVTSIDNYAFWGCSRLKNITIPDGVKSIGRCAFENCSSLVSITIPDSVKSIREWAFTYCTNLTSVIIPDSVESIGMRAFEHCSGLKTYKNRYFKATDEKMQCNDFQYEIGKTYKTKKAELCRYGFHACRSPLDIFNYYYGKLGKYVRMFEVELGGVTEENDDDSKVCGTEIKFLRELTISELAKLASDGGVEK